MSDSDAWRPQPHPALPCCSSLTEGDLIIGLKRSAIGTMVERTTGFTVLVHLPRGDGYGVIPRTRNGPAPAGYGAVSMKNALATRMRTRPEHLRRSLTWDRSTQPLVARQDLEHLLVQDGGAGAASTGVVLERAGGGLGEHVPTGLPLICPRLPGGREPPAGRD